MNTPTTRRWPRVLPAVALAACLAGMPARASDTYSFTVTQASSTVSTNVNASANFSGTLRGNWDATTNPGGTRTLLGTFGSCGAGNQPIPYTGTGTATGSPMTHPTGTFTLTLDTAVNTISVTGINLDLLGGATPTIVTNATIHYQSFRTCQPTGYFPSLGGVPVPVDDAVVNGLTGTQIPSCSAAALTPAGPNHYTFSIPTTVLVTSNVTFGGGPLATDPQAVPIVFAGSVTVSGATAAASVNLSINITQNNNTPTPGPQDVPFDLANPLGGTCHLLLNVTIDSSSFTLTGNVGAAATGVRSCRCDWNHSGAVNSQDFFDFLTSFFGGDADFNCDGATNSQDFFDFLGCFFTGCG